MTITHQVTPAHSSNEFQPAPATAEEPVEQVLARLAPHLDPEAGLLSSVYSLAHHHDEIRFHHFGGELADDSAATDGRFIRCHPGGYGLDRSLALLKFLGESIERYCIQIYRTQDLIYAPYHAIAEQAIDLCSIASYSKRLRMRHPHLSTTAQTVFGWTQGVCLHTGKHVLLPAQLVYLSYVRRPSETTIYHSISTGAAGGSTLASSICRGICEIVERDAFMIFYLNRLPAYRVDLAAIDDGEVQLYVRLFSRYRLELSVFDLSTDLNIPTFMALCVDRTGIGPAVSVGLKSHLDPLTAIRESILESQHSRGWIRRVAQAQPELVQSIAPSAITTTQERGLYWFPRAQLRHLDFLLHQPPQPLRHPPMADALSDEQQLARLVEQLASRQIAAYYADVTTPRYRASGYTVTKVVIPQLIPLYLDERFPHLGGRRLYDVPVLLGMRHRPNYESQLNRVPHPFL